MPSGPRSSVRFQRPPVDLLAAKIAGARAGRLRGFSGEPAAFPRVVAGQPHQRLDAGEPVGSRRPGPGGILGDLLVKKCGWKPGKRLQLKIRIAAEAGDRVIAFAYKQESPEARQAVLKELKEMLTRYLLP